MKLIVGLGNPGKKYVNNRHNLGFMVTGKLIVDRGLAWKKDPDLLCDLAKDGDLIVIKPKTFMNKSGDSVKLVSNYYKIDAEDILTIYDDLDLEFGKIRLAFDGSSAGHKGVESVIRGLGTSDFPRLRIGIGRPFPAAPNSGDKPPNAEDFVLADFLPEEREKLEPVIKKAIEAINSYLSDGILATMNSFN